MDLARVWAVRKVSVGIGRHRKAMESANGEFRVSNGRGGLGVNGSYRHLTADLNNLFHIANEEVWWILGNVFQSSLSEVSGHE